MYKGKKNIGIRIFFLALFVSYFADINFFTHNHIINGVTIVHSHFSYNTPDSSSPDTPQNHNHSNNALNLISHAAVWIAVLLQAPEISCTASICNIRTLPTSGSEKSGNSLSAGTSNQLYPKFIIQPLKQTNYCRGKMRK